MLKTRSAQGCCSLPKDNPYENFKKFRNLIKDHQETFNYEWDKRQVLRNAMNYEWDKRQVIRNAMKKEEKKDEYDADAYTENHTLLLKKQKKRTEKHCNIVILE